MLFQQLCFPSLVMLLPHSHFLTPIARSVRTAFSWRPSRRGPRTHSPAAMPLHIHVVQHAKAYTGGMIEDWAHAHRHKYTSTHLWVSDAHLPAVNQFDWLVLVGGPLPAAEGLSTAWVLEELTLVKEAIQQVHRGWPRLSDRDAGVRGTWGSRGGAPPPPPRDVLERPYTIGGGGPIPMPFSPISWVNPKPIPIPTSGLIGPCLPKFLSALLCCLPPVHTCDNPAFLRG